MPLTYAKLTEVLFVLKFPLYFQHYHITLLLLWKNNLLQYVTSGLRRKNARTGLKDLVLKFSFLYISAFQQKLMDNSGYSEQKNY